MTGKSEAVTDLKMVRTFKQPKGSGLCLAACGVTLTGEGPKTIDTWTSSGLISDMSPGEAIHLTDRRYMPLWGLTAALAYRGLRLGMTWNCGHTSPGNFYRGSAISVDLLVEEIPAVLIVESGQGSDHAVVWDNIHSVVRDPSNNAADTEQLCDYDVIEWIPVTRFDE